MRSFPSFFAGMRILHVRDRTQRDRAPPPPSIFSKYCSFKVSRHCWIRKFLSPYSSSFLRIRRIRGKYLSVYRGCAESIKACLETRQYFSIYEEYCQFRVVCRIQNCLQICRKYLNVFGDEEHGEDSCRIFLIRQYEAKKLSISRLIIVNHENFFDPYFLYKMGWNKPKNPFMLLSL